MVQAQEDREEDEEVVTRQKAEIQAGLVHGECPALKWSFRFKELDVLGFVKKIFERTFSVFLAKVKGVTGNSTGGFGNEGDGDVHCQFRQLVFRLTMAFLGRRLYSVSCFDAYQGLDS